MTGPIRTPPIVKTGNMSIPLADGGFLALIGMALLAAATASMLPKGQKSA
jgi:hypothetical protein